jgi:multidrug efflux pump subunit AcrB
LSAAREIPPPAASARDQDQAPPGGGVARFFVEHRKIGWVAMAAVLLWGILAFRSLPQQEDPTFPRHDALIVTLFPGASVRQVEKSVTAKVEAELADFYAVEEVRSQSRANVSVVYVMLHSHRKNVIAQQWSDLRDRLRNLRLPEGCEPPRLDTEFQATATLLLSVVSSRNSYPELAAAADQLKGDLKRLSSVNRVRLFGDLRERVELRFSATNLLSHGIGLDTLTTALAALNSVIPAETFSRGLCDLPIEAGGKFNNEGELGETPVTLDPGGLPIRVRDLCQVWRGCEDPANFSVDTLHRTAEGALIGEHAVLLAVEMKGGEIIGQFDRAVRAAVNKLALPPGMQVLTLSDQPAATSSRIAQFIKCFLEALAIVVLVCLLLMNWRTALVVAIAVPLTLALTFGGMSLLGIPLQQISIAALIIALGMLVDDPVVAADGINRELAAGRNRGLAAWFGPYRLRRAIFFGTIINIVAFLPLALLPGDMGAFIIALPLVITLALAASRIVSMTFIPLLGYHLLTGQRGFETGGEIRSSRLFAPVDRALNALLQPYRTLLQGALNHPVWTLAVAYSLLAASGGFVHYFGHQFFPPAERHQCLIDVELPQGASIGQTRKLCGRIAAILQTHDTIVSAALFHGGTAPNFYYNILPRQPAPNLAQVLINTRTADEVPPLIVQLRAELDHEITNATCVVRQLDQGPAMEAPIMIRLTGPDLAHLREQADRIAEILRAAGGYKVTDDLGQPAPVLGLDVQPEFAEARGISPSQIGRLVQSAFAGFPLGELRERGHLLPVLVRMQPADLDELTKIGNLPIAGAGGQVALLRQVATVSEIPEYGVISHSAGLRSVTVKAYAPFGELPSRVLAKARQTIDQLRLPAGYTRDYGGEARELQSSRREMRRVMVISLGLIALTMVIQFKSMVKSLVVILTVPLGLAGAFAGMAIMHASFGFMALLGIVSLAGVIVSHIIVLSDFIEEARSNGMPLKQALLQAGLVRLRAVMVTVLATVCGLIPLALQGGELWRPLTSVHIFGLLLATLLTLLVLPVWYYLLSVRLHWIK